MILITWHLMYKYYECSRSTGQRSRLERDITYQHEKIVTCHERIGWLRLNLNMWHTVFKVIKVNIKIAITPPWIVRFRSNLVQSLITSQATHRKCSRSSAPEELCLSRAIQMFALLLRSGHWVNGHGHSVTSRISRGMP